MKPSAILALGVVSIASCAPLTAQDDVYARIVEPTPESRAELREAVSRALNGRPVTLADDAFTRSSTLSLERAEPAGGRDRPATGRTLGTAVELRLVTDGNGCFVVYRDMRIELEATQCVAE